MWCINDRTAHSYSGLGICNQLVNLGGQPTPHPTLINPGGNAGDLSALGSE